MRIITVSGADVSLFHVAARELGDATQWWRIARANGVNDPMLSAIQPLLVPDRDPSSTLSGGLPPQD